MSQIVKSGSFGPAAGNGSLNRHVGELRSGGKKVPVAPELTPGFCGAVERIGLSMPMGQERTLRGSQLDVFRRLRGKRKIILNSPTGWGKTTELLFLAADRLIDDPKAKILILVPQRIIARGFTRPSTIRLPDGFGFDWRVGHDLCGDSAAKARRLVAWLEAPAAVQHAGRVAVTTHSTFVATFERLARTDVFDDLTLIIDESHHVLAAGEEYGFNELGLCIDGLLKTDASLWFSTAFFFRGDRLPILGGDDYDEFSRVFIPFDTHLGEMQHLTGYSYDFVAYKQTVFAELESILRHSQEPTLVYAPPSGSPVLGTLSKRDFIARVLELAREHYGEHAKLLDLTDHDTRGDDVDFLHEHGDRVSLIVTVGMMKEGADWPRCARVIDLVPSNSDQERNQKFGRLMRDFPGKPHVRYYSFLPLSITTSVEKQREDASKLFAHFHASLVLENALKPIRVPILEGTQGIGKATGPGRVAAPGGLADLLGKFESKAQQEIEEKVGEALVSHAAAREVEGGALSWEEAGKVIDSVLKRLGCGEVVGPENLPGLGKQIILLWRRRRSPDLDVANLVASGFDKVWAVDALDSMKMFSAGMCGRPTFVELREVLGSIGLENAERWAKHFVRRYSPDNLPSEKSLDPGERADGQRLSNLKKAKLGRGTHIFYPSVEGILAEAGFVGILDVADKQMKAEEWARCFVRKYAPARLPSENSNDPAEKADCFRLQKLKLAKDGKGDNTYYPSVEKIFEEGGFVGLLRTTQQRAEDWARDFVGRYRPDRLPRKAGPDASERSDYSKLRHLRDAVAGKGRCKPYPSVLQILEEGGFADALRGLPSGRFGADGSRRSRDGESEGSTAGSIHIPLIRPRPGHTVAKRHRHAPG